MFGSNILDVAVGLVIVFLVLSLSCTAVNEVIAALAKSRARRLERGIRNLLDAASKTPATTQGSEPDGAMPKGVRWADAIIGHQLVKALGQEGAWPSYIPSATFAAALLSVVRQTVPKADDDRLNHPILGGLSTFDDIRAALLRLADCPVRSSLLSLLEVARADVTDGVTAIHKFNAQIETWFDQAMDRVSGWYRRNTRYLLLVVGVLAAAALNVDVVTIARALATNDTLRSSVVAAAKSASEQHAQAVASTQPAVPRSTREAIADVRQGVRQLDGLGIPMGWSPWAFAHPAGAPGPYVSSPGTNLYDLSRSSFPTVLFKFFGLLTAGLAASLGAPFWFDVLNKFMSVPTSGPAPEERPKDPKTVPQPKEPGQ